MTVELTIVTAVLVLLAVALAAAAGPRLGVPAPLVLVVLGVGVSLLPFVPEVAVPPEVVLMVVLPPLLYSASVSVPAMDLRRELGAVSLLSVALVVVSALVLGGLFTVLVPGLEYSWGVALGAVISPTDAVATSIVKQATVSPRVSAILEGESLLNDASALVLLRAAVAGAATTVSVWGVAGQFAWAVAVAVVVGVFVGRLALRVRARVGDPTVTTVISFTVPFAASLPAEALQGSGLVAAVVAGLVVGRRGPRVLGPQHRRSDRENWATVSLVLEGAVFLLMGLEIAGIVADVDGPAVVLHAAGLAVVALLAVLLVRGAVVAPLLAWLHLSSRRMGQARHRVEALRDQVQAGQAVAVGGRRKHLGSDADRQRLGRRMQSVLASIDYIAASPLGPREGAVVVWAGMRGAVTVAAAQTLPTGDDGPQQRSLLVLVAFGVAVLSLLLQGGTLSPLIRWLRPAVEDPDIAVQERARVLQLVQDFADSVQPRPQESTQAHRLRQLDAARQGLLDARDLGVYNSQLLGGALDAVDAEDVALQARGGTDG